MVPCCTLDGMQTPTRERRENEECFLAALRVLVENPTAHPSRERLKLWFEGSSLHQPIRTMDECQGRGGRRRPVTLDITPGVPPRHACRCALPKGWCYSLTYSREP